MILKVFCAQTYEAPNIEFTMFVIPRGQHGGEAQISILPLSASIEEVKVEAAEICRLYGIEATIVLDKTNLSCYAPSMGMRARIRSAAPPVFEIGAKVRFAHCLDEWEVLEVIDEPKYFHDTHETLSVRKVRAKLLSNGYETVSSSFFLV